MSRRFVMKLKVLYGPASDNPYVPNFGFKYLIYL